MKKVTIKDVARKLNFSVSTISRAFNDKYDINPATKELIVRTAQEMGYSPSLYARQLTQNRSRLIGVIVPEFINAFFPSVISGIHKIAKSKGYQLLIMSSDEHASEEMENLSVLVQGMVDGILISFVQEAHDISPYLELNDRIPIVQFNRVNPKLNTSKVIFDDYKWAFAATEHLVEQGYSNIYHLKGPSNLIISHQREKGFMDAMKKHGLPYQGHCIESGIFIEDGKQVANKLFELPSLPDAIFCFNDPVAIGVMEELRSKNVAVPQSVALVGFTESLIASHTTPMLTSVEQPAIEMGETAAKILIEEIEAQQRPSPKTIVLDGELHVRDSSLKN